MPDEGRERRRRPFRGVPVNEVILKPKPPGKWVDEERCICGATYRNYRANPTFSKAHERIRALNGGFKEGGGFRTLGPVLWMLHVMKLEDWYLEHALCGEVTNLRAEQVRPCHSCKDVCPWCAGEDAVYAIALAAK